MPAISKERLDEFVQIAAREADYEAGFGVDGCDLEASTWWAAYTRQSTREQTENDRVVEYLFTCAKMAKQRGAVVPREYIIYDANTSENLDRPGMIYLRTELIAGRRIARLP